MQRRDLLHAGSFGWHWTDQGTGEDRGSIGITVLGNEIRLDFTSSGEAVHQRVPIERTRCHYGGMRPWFHCPRCQRRVAVLFLRNGRFMCRHCGRVAYSSQSDDLIGKTWRREQRLESRLGPNWTRPKGMHLRTYERIIDAILVCQRERDGALVDFMQRLGNGMGLEL
ncbi:MAG TPA: hypothetical protein PLA97_05550 [Rubrivivax sp.]|nr:hypothetical protein [Rubrivivax sp.]